MPEVIDELFGLHGAPTTTSANDPLPLIDPGAVWLVTRGHVDIEQIYLVVTPPAVARIVEHETRRIGPGRVGAE